MSAAPIHLKVRDVALAAKKAYDEGRLSAQGPTPACQYRDLSGRPCAIGAALTDAQAGGLCGAIEWLIGKGRVRSRGHRALAHIRRAHDRWAGAEGPSEFAKHEAGFLKALRPYLAKTEA